MRELLLDAARARATGKRGGNQAPVNREEVPDVSTRPGGELIALDDAVNALAAVDARKDQVVELRSFGGLSVEETAAVLKVSPERVMRDWGMARAWLRVELREGGGGAAR